MLSSKQRRVLTDMPRLRSLYIHNDNSIDVNEYNQIQRSLPRVEINYSNQPYIERYWGLFEIFSPVLPSQGRDNSDLKRRVL